MIKVLDSGFVRLVDKMGSDKSVVQAARVSYGYGEGTKCVSNDRTLIRYLFRHRHTSPFEMVEIKLHLKMPIHVARQWIRHRTAQVNEISGRYSELPEVFYQTYNLNTQAQNNKQGRTEELIEDANFLLDNIIEHQKESFRLYQDCLHSGVAKEIARMHLPLNTYTEFYWKINLHNLFHFLKLRMDLHAQYEIRQYANIISQIVQKLFPLSYEAFVDYSLEAKIFSRMELELNKFVKEHNISQGEKSILLEDKITELGLSKREIEEFWDKI